jgi:osmoprotectant transport system substrate-binding protein
VRRRGLTTVAILLALVAACAGAGCGGDAGAKAPGDVTITVGSLGYPEDELLREIYAHALEAAGFQVRRSDLAGGLLLSELENGRISGYPEHLNIAFAEATGTEQWGAPADTKVAYRETKARFTGKGVVPFPPTSFRRSSAIAIQRTTAEQGQITSLSDLKGQAGGMSVMAREVYCYGRVRCVGGFENGYGVVFGGYSGISLREPPSVLYKALRSGEEDSVVVVNTEGRLARRPGWLVVLEDDRDRMPAANALWLTNQDVVDEAGPDYERAILAAQKGLTVQVMRRLNAEVEQEGKPPGEVAAEYLDATRQGG